MKLVDRYVVEVAKHLPFVKGQKDIENELRSTLEDMLEDRAQKAGRPADEAMEIELLKEYGAPEKVAATYNPMPYLIGPRMFPFFIMVLKIVITVVTVVLLITTGIQIATQTAMMGKEFVNIVGKGLGGIISAAIAAFGNVVLVFAILERVLPDSQIASLKTTDVEWDPATLANEPNPDTIKRGELIAEIIFTFAGLVILNLYPHMLGFSFFVEDNWFFIPMFSDAFLRFIPWINLTLLAEIVLDIYLLRQNIWAPVTRMIKIIIEAASLAITVVIFRTPNIIGFTAESFTNSPINPETAQTLTTVFTTMFPFILIIIMIIQGIELAKAVYKLLKIKYEPK